MTEQFCFQVQDSGEGPLQVLVPADRVEEFKGLLREMGERSVGVGPLEEPGWGAPGAGAVPEESSEEPQELEDFTGLCCPLNDGPWKDSPCEEFTGWSEEEAVQELAKHALLVDLKQLRDEGVI